MLGAGNLALPKNRWITILGFLLLFSTIIEVKAQRNYIRPSRHHTPVTYPTDHWPNCTIEGRIHGTCQKIVQCPEAVVAVLRGYHPPICFWERYKTFPLVCCPAIGDGSLNEVLPQKPDGDIQYQNQGLDTADTCGLTKYETTEISASFAEEHELGFVPAFRRTNVPKPSVPVRHRFSSTYNTKSFKEVPRDKRNSKDNKWPWMISVYGDATGSSLICNGFLIDDRHVLTAGQKLAALPVNGHYTVRIGGPEDQGSLYQVSKIVIHEEYKSWAKYNDLAVLELKLPVTETGVLPLCLSSGNVNVENVAGFNATILGQTTFEEVPIVSHSWCAEMYSRYAPLTYPRGITDQFLCGGLQLNERPHDGVGDLGGPVMIKVNNRWTAIGMVSLDYKCANQGFPGVYINLLKYTDWIRNAISN